MYLTIKLNFKRNFRLKAELREEGTTRLSEARYERHGRDKVYLVKVRRGGKEKGVSEDAQRWRNL